MKKKWLALPRQLLAQVKKIDFVKWRPYFLGLLGLVFLALLVGWILQLPPKAPKFKALDGDTYQYQAKNKLFTSKLGLREEKPIVAFNLPGGENVVFTYAEASDKPDLQNSADKELIFHQVEPGIDLRYETLANGLKEEIILHQARQKTKDAHVFTFDSTFQGAYPKETIKGFAGFVFYNQENDYLFHFEKPFAIDAAGNRTDDVILQIEEKNSSKLPEVKRSDNGETPYLIRLSVDEAWLNDPARVYPIIIDPTIVHDESSEFATGNFDRSKDTGSGSSPVIESFYQEWSADAHTIGLWHLNETSGSSVSDKSGNGNNGNASGTTIVDGLLSKARSFNGSSDYVEIGDLNEIDNAQTLSGCAWAYHSSDSADQQIITKSNSATDGFFLFRDEAAFVSGRTDVYAIYIADGNDTDNVRVESVSNAGLAGNWNHVCFTFEGGKEQGLRLYINGQEDPNSPVSTTTISNIDAGNNPLRIGSGSTGGSNFHGSIDEVILSKRVFSAEEIKNMASRSPYSTYTSPVIDLTGVNSWNSFAWSELGITTGDGETLKDTTGLVAQWNFNNTSGTTATNNAGSCGASCNASLTGFDSTASQDADPDSSWTANDRRWGAGALTFDGVDTYVTIPDHNSLSFGSGGTDSPFSISMWFKVRAYDSSTGNWLISKRNADAADEYQIVYSADQTISAIVMSGNSNYIGQRTIRPLPVGEWHHMTVTYDGSKNASGIKVYINGKLEPSTVNNVGTYTGMNNGAHPVLIGKPNWTATRFFNGTIDSTYIFSRQLSAAEILSNYQAGNIELQTRVGTSANADDGSWDAWTPLTSEALLKSFDLDISENWLYRRQIPITHTGSAVSEYQVLVENLETASLISAGKMQSDCDDMRFTNTSGELLNYSIIGNTCNTSNTQVWVQTDSIPSSGGSTIYLFYGNPKAQRYASESKTFSYSSEKPVAYILDNDVDQLEIISLENNNTITHNSVTRSLSKYATSNFTSISQFGVISAKKPFNADDASDNTDGLVPVSAAGTEFLFTARSTATYTFYAVAPWGNATVDVYNAGGNCTGNNVTGAGATINCTTITAGAVRITSTVPVLIFAETTTTDPMILRPASMQKWIGAGTQSRVTSGPSGADYRYYDSNTVSETDPADLGANATVSLGGGTYGNAPAFLIRSTNHPIGYSQYGDGDGSDGIMQMTLPDMSATYGSAVGNTDYISIASDQAVNCTAYNATTKAVIGSGTATSANSSVYFLGFGVGDSSSIVAAPWFMECSAPVAAYYQKGADSESSLFGSSMMRQFTYPTPSVGALGSEESISSYSGNWLKIEAENQSTVSFETDSVIKLEGAKSQKIETGKMVVDENTAALWSFEETAGTGAYIKDASGNGNHGTPTSTTVSNGISGKARTFSGGSENISLGNPSSLQLTGNQTIEMWLYPTDMSVRRNPYAKAYGGEGTITQEIAGTLSYYYGTSGANAVPYQGFGTATAIPTNQWSHVAIVRDLTNMQLYWYVNGVLNNQVAASYPAATASSLDAYIGQGYTNNYVGKIDEFRISNVARSAEEIAESYRLGRDQHLSFALPTTDLSSKKALPFYVAADRPGSYLQATLGESAFANYLPDENTVGLWHLDDDNSSSGVGGTVTYAGGYTIHTFTSSGTFTANAPINAEVLTVAGGGGGANTGSGGGAGGYVYKQYFHVPKGGYNVTVGAGGAGGASTGAAGAKGENSVFYSITAEGGGGGVTHGGTAGGNGGSGGGGPIRTAAPTATGGTASQGNVGGAGFVQASWTGNSGGGGGAGGAGAAGGNSAGTGNGGVGLANSISGASVFYAGGGGGGEVNGSFVGAGGNGGGGSAVLNAAGGNGTANTGGGGGGGSYTGTYFNGGNGGSGIVIIRYPTNRSSSLKDSSFANSEAAGSGLISTTGKVGKGKYFNGTNNTINVKNNANININGSGSAATIELWVKPNTLAPTWQNIVYKNSGAADCGETSCSDRQFSMFLHSSGYIHFTSTSANNVGVAQTSFNTPAGLITVGKWHHIVGVIDSPNSVMRTYINGQEVARTAYSNTGIRSGNGDLYFGSAQGASSFFQGTIDEVRISKVARSADEIRQAYEYGMGLRSHPITIDFAAKLDAADLIVDSNDLSFGVDATYHGLSQKGSKLFTGDKIIIRENYDGTQYLAQGTVSSVNVSTGATSVSAWDSGSTFPPSGFSVYADVFKWQREYWSVDGKVLDSHLDAITNLTLRVTDGSQGRTIWLDDLRSSEDYLTNSAGSTITSDTNNRYFQYRAILSSNDSAVSPSLSSASLDYEANAIPNTPTLNSPADAASNQSPTPTLQTTATDNDGDYLRYKIELCTNLAMTTSCQTFDQTSSQTGWSGQNTQTSTAYTSGTQATYTLQSDLLPNTTYYWRSYAVDPGATNIWSATQGTPRSFTTSAGPSAPTDPYTEGASNPISVADLTPEFSAVHNDPDGDAAIYYEVEVNTASDFSGTVMWDSGKQSMTSTANGARSPEISYAGTTLSFNGAVYYWRIKFWDSFDIEGAWSATNNFTMSAPPNVPLLDSPPNASTDVAFKPTLQTTATDNDGDYLRYKIELCTNLAMTTSCQTFDQTSSQTGWSGQNTQTNTAYTSGTQATYTLQSDLLPNTTYYWRSYAVDPAGSNTWSATQGTPRSFTTLATPLPASACYLQKSIANDQILISWTDNASNEDFYEVQRSVNGGAWTTLQSGLSPNTTSLLDTGVTQDNTYQYRVAPYFTGPMYAAWCVASQLNLGVGLFNLEGLNVSGLHFN